MVAASIGAGLAFSCVTIAFATGMGTKMRKQKILTRIAFIIFTLTSIFSCTKSSDSKIDNPVDDMSNDTAFYFMSHKQINRFKPDGMPEKIFDVSADNKGWLGINDSVMADVDELSFFKGFDVNVRNYGDGRFQNVRTFSFSDTPNFFIRGPVQPSPNGKLLMVPISIVTEGVGERILGFNVVDELKKIIYTRTNALDPMWISDTELVSSFKDELLRHTITTPNSATRIGATGLGSPGNDIRQVSVSPNGQMFSYIQDEAVWVANIDGGNVRKLTQTRTGQNWPTWSPDSELIAVVVSQCPPVGAGAPNPEIAILDITEANKDVTQVEHLQQSDGQPFRSCGPIYWK